MAGKLLKFLSLSLSLSQNQNLQLKKRLSDKAYPDNGAFGEYIIAKSNLQLEIPDFISYEEAATLGVAVTTVVSLSSLSHVSWRF